MSDQWQYHFMLSVVINLECFPILSIQSIDFKHEINRFFIFPKNEETEFMQKTLFKIL